MRTLVHVLICAGLTSGLPQGGGKCTTTADCVAPNVCSKWGWCQWTKIYGEDGPSQGSSAPGEGRAGQCVTSKDCAPRVPYCSKLGFCHGGVVPFDEEQLEIDPEVKQTQAQDQPYGYLNNDPRKNSPVFLNQGGGGQPKAASSPQTKQQGQRQQQASQKSPPQAKAPAVNESGCAGGSLDACVEACPSEGYSKCVSLCGRSC